MRTTRRAASAALIIATAVCAVPPDVRAADPGGYQSLLNAYYQDSFRAHPLVADGAGFHEWDATLDDVTLAGHQAEQKRLHSYLDRFQAIDPAGLSPTDHDDREVVIAEINAGLLEEERIQAWRHDPDHYSALVTEAMFQLVKRDYAPLADRMRYAIAREQRVPDILATGKALIENPPKVYVEETIENLDGALDFFKTGLPEAFKSVDDPALRQQFSDTNTRAIAALEDFKAWLQKILPEAHGDFALGPRNYRLKLDYEEMVDLPLDQLLAVGVAQLKKDQQAFADTVRRIDPDKSPDAVVADLEKDHPTADSLIPTAREQLVKLRQFIVDRKLTPLPPERMPTVGPTPKFERALIEAELDPPGPYDKKATEAFYFVTPPAADLKPAEQDLYLEAYNIPVLNNVSVHEVFPGHFIQLMLMRSLPGLSMVRRLAGANSNVEGWAHYCEQMTLDEGFGGDDPKLRLGQVLDALLRDSRYIAGIRMHTAGMSIEQATQIFITEGHQTPAIAEKEAKRGTSDPTYLYYTLGKLEILKLRDDWKAKIGDQYSIGAFHKRLMEGGTVPIKMIRREMMGADGPLL